MISQMTLLVPTIHTGDSEEFTDTWKVLVYDQACRDIISPLMNIGALRQKGVTLHMLVGEEVQLFILCLLRIKISTLLAEIISPSIISTAIIPISSVESQNIVFTWRVRTP